MTEVLIHTGQHYDDAMSDVFFRDLGLAPPTHHLGVGSARHGAQTGTMMKRLEPILVDLRPDVVVVFGDTNSTLAAALVAAKLRLPVAHVEAGLRSFNRQMPEEINRCLTDHISDLLLCPSAQAVGNLEREGITGGVHITGDVMLDALEWVMPDPSHVSAVLDRYGLVAGGYAVATVHRAESTDDAGRLGGLLTALGDVAADGLPVILPLHPRTAGSLNGLRIPAGVRLVEPVGHAEMVALASRGTHRAHRLGWPPEGAVLAGCALCDHARRNRVGRDRGRRLERGGGCRPDGGRRRRPANGVDRPRRPPADIRQRRRRPSHPRPPRGAFRLGAGAGPVTAVSHWGVVGGGMLGMTLAMRLRQAGHRVTLLEGADQLGGLASTWQLGDVVWDKHYHVTLLSDSSLRTVLDELGLADELRWVETRTGCYTDGRLYSVSNTAEFLRFPPLGIVDKLRLGWTVYHASRIDDWERLEEIPVEDWLVRHSGRRTFDKFWKPLLRSKLGENYRSHRPRSSGRSSSGCTPPAAPGSRRRCSATSMVAMPWCCPFRRSTWTPWRSRPLTGHPVNRRRSRAGAGRVHQRRPRTFDHVVLTAARPVAAMAPQLRDTTEIERATWRRDVPGHRLRVAAARPPARRLLRHEHHRRLGAVYRRHRDVHPGGPGASAGRPWSTCRVTWPRTTRSGQDGRRDPAMFLAALERMYPRSTRDQVLAFQVSRVKDVLRCLDAELLERVPPASRLASRGLHRQLGADRERDAQRERDHPTGRTGGHLSVGGGSEAGEAPATGTEDRS